MRSYKKAGLEMLVFLWPLVYFLFKYIPVQDAWAHAYTVFSLNNIGTSPWKDLLEINLRPYAGWLTDAILLSFLKVFGFRTGTTFFFVILTISVMVFFYRYLNSWGNKTYAMALALIMGVNIYLIKGFFAFSIGLVFLVYILSKLEKKEDTKLWVFLVIGEFFIHPFYFAESLLMLFWKLFTDYMERSQKRGLLIYMGPIILIGIILVFLRFLGLPYVPFTWQIPFVERVKLLLTGGYILPWFRLEEGGYFLAGYLVLFTTFLLGYVVIVGCLKIKEYSYGKNWPTIEKIRVFTGMTNLLLFFTIFDVIKTGSYIHTRQIFMALVLLLPLFIKRWRVPRVVNNLVLIYLFTVFGIQMYNVFQRFRKFDKRFEYAIKIASDFIPNKKVFYSYTRFLPAGGYAYPGVHVGGVIGIKRNALYVNNVDFLGTYQPLKIKNAQIYYHLLESNCEDISKIALDYIFVYTNNKRIINVFSKFSCDSMFITLFENDSVLILKRSGNL